VERVTKEDALMTRRWTRSIAPLLAGLTGLCLVAGPAGAAGEREIARRMHDRLVGVPPDTGTLDLMEQRLLDGDPAGAADLAMAHPVFYSSTLVRWATPWSNEEQSAFEDFNDFTALVVGTIRDRHPFGEVLWADRAYVGANGVVGAGYEQDSNEHYRQLQDDRVDLSRTDLFVEMPQSQLPGSVLNPADTAGLMTTRAGAKAYFSAGTNRAMFRFTSMNFLCRDLEDLQDNTRPADRIRQDVTRSPGGDSRIFVNTCLGCHSGMDPMAGAFAYYEWDKGDEEDPDDGRLVYTRGDVQEKYGINANVFPFGYVTVDDRWDNFWREGPRSNLGWSDALPGGGYGAKSLGQELAGSRAFAVCQVQKVFRQVCFREPSGDAEHAVVEGIATTFQGSGQDLKQVFADVAYYCASNE